MAGEWHEMNAPVQSTQHVCSVDELRNYQIPAETMGGGGRLFDWGYCLTVHKAQGSQFDQSCFRWIDRKSG